MYCNVVECSWMYCNGISFDNLRFNVEVKDECCPCKAVKEDVWVESIECVVAVLVVFESISVVGRVIWVELTTQTPGVVSFETRHQWSQSLGDTWRWIAKQRFELPDVVNEEDLFIVGVVATRSLITLTSVATAFKS